jgi:hypothetical protein
MPLTKALGIKAGDYLDLEVTGCSLSIGLKKRVRQLKVALTLFSRHT